MSWTYEQLRAVYTGRIRWNAFYIFFLLVNIENINAIDCNLSKNYVEKTICSDRFLISLDQAMNENYNYMRHSQIGYGALKNLKNTQKKWLFIRNQCTDKECIKRLYKNRLDEVCEYPVISGIHPICKDYNEVLSMCSKTIEGDLNGTSK